MRAVCTRSGRRGWVYAHTRGLCRSEGVELSVSLSLSFFLHATTERIHPRAKKLYYFGGKILFDPPPILLLSRFASFFFFFQTDHPLFWTASPPERDGNHGGEKPQLLCRDSQPDSLLFLVIILCAFRSVLLQLRSLRGRLTGIYLRFVCICMCV